MADSKTPVAEIDVRITRGLYSKSPEDQISALQLVQNEGHFMCDGDATEAAARKVLFESCQLPRIKHILKTSGSSRLQVEALQCLNLLGYSGEKIYWFDLMGIITQLLLTGDETVLVHLVTLFIHITDNASTDTECLHRFGVIDALCIRITSATLPSTAIKLLSVLFSLIRASQETQCSESAFVCAKTVLSQQEGVLSTDEVQLSCVQALKSFVEPSVNLVMFLKSGLVEMLMARLRTDARREVQRCIVCTFVNLSLTHEGARILLQARLIDVLLMFLTGSNETDDLFDRLFWLVGKITGDYLELRDLTIKSGVVQEVVKVASAENLSTSVRRRLMRILALFFIPDPDGVPPDLARDILQILKVSLKSCHDKVQLDALYGLQCLTVMYTGTSFQGVEYVTELDFIPCLLKVLRSEQRLQSRSALGVVCNIAKSEKEGPIQLLLDNGLLQYLAENLRSSVDVFETVVILRSVAKCGYSEDICGHISVALFLEVITRYPIQIGKCVLETLRIMVKADKPRVLHWLVDSPLLQFLRDIDDVENSNSHRSWHPVQSLNSLAAEVEVTLTEAAKKCGLDVDSLEDVDTDGRVCMDCSEALL